jgi:hypothetical protein
MAQTGIAITGEDRLLAFPDALMDVHARAVVAKERLGHEGRGHAALPRDTLHHIFVDHHIVGHARECGEAHVDLALTAGRHFMMVGLNRNAELLEQQHHFGARILERIRGRYREISRLGAQLVT